MRVAAFAAALLLCVVCASGTRVFATVFSRSNAGQRVVFDLATPNTYIVAVADTNDYEAVCVFAGGEIVAAATEGGGSWITLFNATTLRQTGLVVLADDTAVIYDIRCARSGLVGLFAAQSVPNFFFGQLNRTTGVLTKLMEFPDSLETISGSTVVFNDPLYYVRQRRQFSAPRLDRCTPRRCSHCSKTVRLCVPVCLCVCVSYCATKL